MLLKISSSTTTFWCKTQTPLRRPPHSITFVSSPSVCSTMLPIKPSIEIKLDSSNSWVSKWSLWQVSMTSRLNKLLSMLVFWSKIMRTSVVQWSQEVIWEKFITEESPVLNMRSLPNTSLLFTRHQLMTEAYSLIILLRNIPDRLISFRTSIHKIES